jgi:hypothetical protein
VYQASPAGQLNQNIIVSNNALVTAMALKGGSWTPNFDFALVGRILAAQLKRN